MKVNRIERLVDFLCGAGARSAAPYANKYYANINLEQVYFIKGRFTTPNTFQANASDIRNALTPNRTIEVANFINGKAINYPSFIPTLYAGVNGLSALTSSFFENGGCFVNGLEACRLLLAVATPTQINIFCNTSVTPAVINKDIVVAVFDYNVSTVLTGLPKQLFINLNTSVALGNAAANESFVYPPRTINGANTYVIPYTNSMQTATTGALIPIYDRSEVYKRVWKYRYYLY